MADIESLGLEPPKAPKSAADLGLAAPAAKADPAARLGLEPPVGPKNPAKVSFIRNLYDRATAKVREIPEAARQNVSEAMGLDKEAMAQIKQGGAGNIAKGAGNEVLSALAHTFAWPDAIVSKIVSEPLSAGTGIPKPYFDVAGSLGLGVGGAMGAAKIAQELKPLVQGVADTFEKIFSPTTVGPYAREAESTIREEIGQGERATAQARAQLDTFAAHVNKMPREDQLDFIGYVEGRGKGATLKDPALAPVADKMKEIYDARRAKLAALPSTEKMSFVEDYYQHMWKEKDKAAQLGYAMSGAPPKMGSGRSLKARSLPTVADGIAAGLTPVTTNPLEQTMMYVTNMDRFIANNAIIDKARAAGTVKYYSPGKQPPGWSQLEGRLAQKTIRMEPGEKAAAAGKEPRAMAMRAYAPTDFARVYNNFVSRGFYQFENGGKVYDALQKTFNSITMSELGLSGFHAYTMAQEAMVDGLARSLGKVTRGEVGGAAKGIAKAVTPWQPGESYLKGKKFEQQFLNLVDHGPDYRKIADIAGRVNFRAQSSRAQYYRGSAMGSYWDAWRRGTLGAETKEMGRDIAKSPVIGSAKAFARTWARTMDTVAQPIFDKMVPRLKDGAFYENMRDWLGAHPNASDAEQLAAGREIGDSIDNRFGELNLENVFWSKMLKQSLQLMVRATGWDLGTLREIGGGAIDLTGTLSKMARGNVGAIKELSPRAKYILALPVIAYLGNQVWSYLKTGKASDDPWTYPTGGTNPDGTPEKAMVPGYMRDVLGYINDPVGELGGKVATAPKTIFDLLTNRDYRDLPIYEGSQWAQSKGAPPWWEAYSRQIVQNFTPLSIRSFTQAKQGTGLSTGERLAGIRPAPMYLNEPENYKQMMERRQKKLDQEKEKSDARILGRQWQ